MQKNYSKIGTKKLRLGYSCEISAGAVRCTVLEAIFSPWVGESWLLALQKHLGLRLLI